MPFQVTGGRIVVTPDALPKEVNGIYLPEANAAQPSTGIVFQSDSEFYQPGMHLAFLERAGTLVKIDGEAYRILDETEVLGILHREATEYAHPV